MLSLLRPSCFILCFQRGKKMSKLSLISPSASGVLRGSVSWNGECRHNANGVTCCCGSALTMMKRTLCPNAGEPSAYSRACSEWMQLPVVAVHPVVSERAHLKLGKAKKSSFFVGLARTLSSSFLMISAACLGRSVQLDSVRCFPLGCFRIVDMFLCYHHLLGSFGPPATPCANPRFFLVSLCLIGLHRCKVFLLTSPHQLSTDHVMIACHRPVDWGNKREGGRERCDSDERKH